MATKFAGFSTKNSKAVNTRLTGKDLVVEDLMNHIMTRKGERVMMPTFGSIVHDLVFEPLVDETRQAIRDDIVSIIKQEPRCSLLNLRIDEEEHSVTLKISLEVKPANEVVELTIDLERE